MSNALKISRLLFLLTLSFFFIVLFGSCTNEGESDQQQTEELNADPIEQKIYLVRHAEKLSGTNPDLTEDGNARAVLLAEILKDSSIVKIHSTNYTRTLKTAQPLADTMRLVIQKYDPSQLDSFAKKILVEKGNQLIVGHSNTTPELVGFLGGDPGDPIVEATEYDRMYILTIYKSGAITTEVRRYGKP